MSKQHLYLGVCGEEAAAGFLKENGYKILSTNYKTKLGEIDIIARDKDTLAFIEVKSRHTQRFGLPQEAVSRHKQRQISKVAIQFLKENNLFNQKARFDVISVVYSPEVKPKLDLIKDAFALDESYVV